MADSPPTLPTAPELREKRTPSDHEDLHRTEAYIGSFVQVRAKELGITVSDSQVRDITSGIAGRLTPAQRTGSASINMADVSGMIEADLRRQSEIGKPVNMYSADAARLEAQSGGGRLGANATLFAGNSIRGRGGDTDNSHGATASSARFDGINTSGLSGLTPSEKLTHSYAVQQGVMWAAENREILKLGTGAIDIIKQTQLRKDVYDGLTKDAHLSSKGALGIAKALHEKGEDANTGGREVTKNLKDINDREYGAAVDRFGQTHFKKDATEEEKEVAREGVRHAGDAAAKRHPEKADKIEQTNKLIGAARKTNEATAALENKQAVNTTNKQTNVGAAKTKTQAKMDAF
jgi:hypothetical protein